jgi:N-acetylglutamate synthase-like GNAT family acetyltransferase
MQIRTADENDIPAIVGLLKESLGESLMPKSEAYWLWKHVQNPFGKSPVLVCEENEKLIGVRAFMRWQWRHNGKIYSTVRAVDTATHPQHQGKGIFKKLTLSLVDRCTTEGDDFVFNTPNDQSKPGYLKMGWVEAGRLPVVLGIRRPLKMMLNILKSPKNLEQALPIEDELNYYLQHPTVHSLLTSSMSLRIQTNLSVDYLKWRYQDVPVVRYVALGQEESGELTGLIIGRVKQSRLGRELRIAECFLRTGNSFNKLCERLRNFIALSGVDYCTVSGLSTPEQQKMTGWFHIKMRLGPSVTIRSLSLNDLGILQNFSQWSPSLGDLELF